MASTMATVKNVGMGSMAVGRKGSTTGVGYEGAHHPLSSQGFASLVFHDTYAGCYHGIHATSCSVRISPVMAPYLTDWPWHPLCLIGISLRRGRISRG